MNSKRIIHIHVFRHQAKLFLFIILYIFKVVLRINLDSSERISSFRKFFKKYKINKVISVETRRNQSKMVYTRSDNIIIMSP